MYLVSTIIWNAWPKIERPRFHSYRSIAHPSLTYSGSTVNINTYVEIGWGSTQWGQCDLRSSPPSGYQAVYEFIRWRTAATVYPNCVPLSTGGTSIFRAQPALSNRVHGDLLKLSRRLYCLVQIDTNVGVVVISNFNQTRYTHSLHPTSPATQKEVVKF